MCVCVCVHVCMYVCVCACDTLEFSTNQTSFTITHHLSTELFALHHCLASLFHSFSACLTTGRHVPMCPCVCARACGVWVCAKCQMPLDRGNCHHLGLLNDS